MFIRLSEAKGHGRRWKFQIDAFRKKSEEGYDELVRWVNNDMGHSSIPVGEDDIVKASEQNESHHSDQANLGLGEEDGASGIMRKRPGGRKSSRGRSSRNDNSLLNEDELDFGKNDVSFD